jgi:hypothetical protein
MGVMIPALGDRGGGKIDIAIEIGMTSMSLGGVGVGVDMRTRQRGIGGTSEFLVHRPCSMRGWKLMV